MDDAIINSIPIGDGGHFIISYPIFYSITVLNLWVTVTVRVLLVIERLGLGLKAPSKGKAPFKLYKIVGSNAVDYNIISNNVSTLVVAKHQR